MKIMKDSLGKESIIMEDKEEYEMNTRRCQRCSHSYKSVSDYNLYCKWQIDGYVRGDWVDCNGADVS
jgi:hypothetical protein